MAPEAVRVLMRAEAVLELDPNEARKLWKCRRCETRSASRTLSATPAPAQTLSQPSVAVATSIFAPLAQSASSSSAAQAADGIIRHNDPVAQPKTKAAPSASAPPGPTRARKPPTNAARKTEEDVVVISSSDDEIMEIDDKDDKDDVQVVEQLLKAPTPARTETPMSVRPTRVPLPSQRDVFEETRTSTALPLYQSPLGPPRRDVSLTASVSSDTLTAVGSLSSSSRQSSLSTPFGHMHLTSSSPSPAPPPPLSRSETIFTDDRRSITLATPEPTQASGPSSVPDFRALVSRLRAEGRLEPPPSETYLQGLVRGASPPATSGSEVIEEPIEDEVVVKPEPMDDPEVRGSRATVPARPVYNIITSLLNDPDIDQDDDEWDRAAQRLAERDGRRPIKSKSARLGPRARDKKARQGLQIVGPMWVSEGQVHQSAALRSSNLEQVLRRLGG